MGLAKGSNNRVEGLVAGWKLPFFKRFARLEQQPYDAGKIAFWMALGDEVTMKCVAQRGALESRIPPADGVSAF